MRKAAVAAAAALIMLMGSAVQGVVINEFYYGTAAPGDNEWVELYNRSGSAIDLNNWKIAVSNGGPFQTVHTITSGSPDTMIQPGTAPVGGYFLIVDGAGTGLDYDANNIDLNLGRDTGTDGFGIALLDDLGTTIDTVLYTPVGGANTYLLVDDDGSTDILRFKGVAGDQSYTREVLGIVTDTNDSSVDFVGTGGPGTPVPVSVSRFNLD